VISHPAGDVPPRGAGRAAAVTDGGGRGTEGGVLIELQPPTAGMPRLEVRFAQFPTPNAPHFLSVHHRASETPREPSAPAWKCPISYTPMTTTGRRVTTQRDARRRSRPRTPERRSRRTPARGAPPPQNAATTARQAGRTHTAPILSSARQDGHAASRPRRPPRRRDPTPVPRWRSTNGCVHGPVPSPPRAPGGALARLISRQPDRCGGPRRDRAGRSVVRGRREQRPTATTLVRRVTMVLAAYVVDTHVGSGGHPFGGWVSAARGG
jgi:hypothetical protein